jgi:hypothetical protein
MLTALLVLLCEQLAKRSETSKRICKNSVYIATGGMSVTSGLHLPFSAFPLKMEPLKM